MDIISIKTQTNRTTNFKDKFNCVNLFLRGFSVGLNVTEWGEKKPIEPKIFFEIKGQDYEIELNEFIKLIEPLLQKNEGFKEMEKLLK